MKVAIIFLGLGYIAACTRMEQQPLDISEYYFPLSEIEGTKIYEYSYESVYTDTVISGFQYSVVEKLSEDRFIFKSLNAELHPTDSSIFKLSSEGVKIESKYSMTSLGWAQEEVRGCSMVHFNTRAVHEACDVEYKYSRNGDVRNVRLDRQVNFNVDFLGITKMDFPYQSNIEATELLIKATVSDLKNDLPTSQMDYEIQVFNAKGIGPIQFIDDVYGDITTTNLIRVYDSYEQLNTRSENN